MLVINSKLIVCPLFSGADTSVDTAVQQTTLLLCQPAASWDLSGRPRGRARRSLIGPACLLSRLHCLSNVISPWPAAVGSTFQISSTLPNTLSIPSGPAAADSVPISVVSDIRRGPRGPFPQEAALRDPCPSFRALNAHLLLPFSQP